MNEPVPHEPGVADAPDPIDPNDLPLGEYIDVTLSLAKWREVLPLLHRSLLSLFPKPIWILLVLGLLGCGGLTVTMAVAQQISFGLVRNFWGSAVFVVVWPVLMFLSYGFNEPWARFGRWYASSGRLDLVAFGKANSFTRATHELGPPRFGSSSPGVLELRGRGRGHDQRIIRLAPSDAAILQRLWDREEIAPAFGSEGDA